MANKALITTRGGARSAASVAQNAASARAIGLAVEAETPAGTLVRGTDAQYEALAAQGYRVKLLTDTNLLRIGGYTIDVEARALPAVPAELDIAATELSRWPHHLVQLAGPQSNAQGHRRTRRRCRRTRVRLRAVCVRKQR